MKLNVMLRLSMSTQLVFNLESILFNLIIAVDLVPLENYLAFNEKKFKFILKEIENIFLSKSKTQLHSNKNAINSSNYLTSADQYYDTSNNFNSINNMFIDNSRKPLTFDPPNCRDLFNKQQGRKVDTRKGFPKVKVDKTCLKQWMIDRIFILKIINLIHFRR